MQKSTRPLKKLGDICDIVGGGTPKTDVLEYRKNGDIEWITPTDLGKVGEIVTLSQGEKKITLLGLQNSSAKLLPIGSVLFSSRASIGKIAIIQKKVCTNQGFASFICKNDLTNNYLAYCLLRNIEEITALSNSTTFKEVSKSSIKEYQIPLPPLLTQNAIVALLDTASTQIQSAKQTLQSQIKNLDALRQSSLSEVFQNDEWDIVRLNDICTKITDGSHNPPKGIANSEYKMISSRNIDDGVLDFDGCRFLSKEDFDLENKRTDVKIGDILLSIVGTIGKVYIVNELHGKFTMQRSLAVIKPDSTKIDSYFLGKFFQSPILQKFINDNAKGAAQKGIYLNSLKELKIPLPPLPTQQSIVAHLNHLNETISLLKTQYQQQLQSYDQLWASILDQAFKGELIS